MNPGSALGSSSARLTAAVAVLAGVWIVTYWWWEPRGTRNTPPITFADDSPERGGDGESPEAADAISLEADRAEAPVQLGPAQLPRDPLAPVPVASTPSTDAASGSPNPPPSSPTVQASPPTLERVATVVPPEFTDYVVRSGDTFGRISTRFFGTPEHARAISRANPHVDPTRLRPGRVVRVPKDPNNIQGKPTTLYIPAASAQPGSSDQGAGEEGAGVGSAASVATRTHIVRAGDSLSRIAQQYLGDHRKADLIFQANRDVLRSPDDLSVGAKLRIPAPLKADQGDVAGTTAPQADAGLASPERAE
ncbi:MAG: LysM peptidoglycan-binding domain-containing protein [Planctomycetota bacterium]|nr:LysM peptidoglycan-binding domain-containing protein [Planctomycetota bacterium]